MTLVVQTPLRLCRAEIEDIRNINRISGFLTIEFESGEQFKIAQYSRGGISKFVRSRLSIGIKANLVEEVLRGWLYEGNLTDLEPRDRATSIRWTRPPVAILWTFAAAAAVGQVVAEFLVT
jgi:hypothetical protein